MVITSLIYHRRAGGSARESGRGGGRRSEGEKREVLGTTLSFVTELIARRKLRPACYNFGFSTNSVRVSGPNVGWSII